MNKPVALNQGDILHILQNANSVPLGQPIWESTEEYNKLKAIIESAIAYTHPVKEQELLDEIEDLKLQVKYLKGCKPNIQLVAELEALKSHPVKELTDAEIMEVATINLGHSMGLLNWMGFAREILRKARE